MLIRLSSAARIAAVSMLALAAAVPARAQGAQTDGRWQAWLGCWEPAGTLVRVVGKSNSALVCVVPSSPASAVDLVTVSGGKVVDRTHVDTDGRQHALTKEGCTGWQSAKWSTSARRVFLKSELNCSGAPVTHVSAIYAMAGYGEWIDAQGVRVDKNSGVHAVRYRESADPGQLPEEVSQKLQNRALARTAAMLAVTEPLSITDVEEASRELDPGVVSTWLVEADRLNVERPAPLNARQLTQLADNGVPASVIDVMVGLSYPDVFSVNGTGKLASRQSGDSVYGGYGSMASPTDLNPLLSFDRFGNPIYASESALLYGCSPFLYGLYNGWNLYDSMYGCNQFGYGYNGLGMYGYGGYPYVGAYGGYYGGGYYGGGPIVVPKGPDGSGAPPHGRVVNGRGYSAGGGGSPGNATPRSNDGYPSGSGSGSSASGGGAPPPPPPPPARTAQPRKP